MKKNILAITITIIGFMCINSQNNNESNLYFPPSTSNDWATIGLEEMGWNSSQLQPLLDYIESKGTKAFIILKNGKIAVEWYGNGANATTVLPWYSAAKTLAAFTIGIAQDEGFLQINNPSSDYLGTGWSSLTSQEENNITVWHHLTMTTGLDYTIFNKNCTAPRCLKYKNTPGSFWYYHNAGYTKSHDIISGAVNKSFESYFYEKLQNKIGMRGEWKRIGYAKPYYSNARSMARFGLLNLNKGIWHNTSVLEDSTYFDNMINSSQSLNKSYGYLYWLNGKDSFKLPGLTKTFKGKLIPNAPNDLFAGLGKNDQKLYIVASKNLVIVRMGNKAKKSRLGPSSFDNQLWNKINNLIN
ncbi:serine hydrolase [Tamlana sp. 2201CG12-4]|uniref:serine hydrolase domain-containing protein n=1 Tax=Tamlana sp. 2201CG12-4 TaxID=3112582 RepID=UPI002DBFBC3D|nr:serine hydrolase [Tamlana sp. 2201CG12-4]MEC3907318.1 serine hydrolase [Tamlana sp. 2201CG12-4]